MQLNVVFSGAADFRLIQVIDASALQPLYGRLDQLGHQLSIAIADVKQAVLAGQAQAQDLAHLTAQLTAGNEALLTVLAANANP